MKEEANTEAIDKIKMASNKICIRNDLAKKNMMFSAVSCQAIMDMGNVELIELKKSRVQCPTCLHYVFEGTILCSCGKHIKSNQEMIDRLRNAFDILKTPFFRASRPNSRCYKHGYQLWQQHHYKANDALRAATRKKDRTFTKIWDRWENGLEYGNSQKAIGWNDELARYLDHIEQIDISHDAPAEQRGRYSNLANLRGIEENMSSSQWSSTSWWSSQEWSSTRKGWQQHSWQDDKWSDQRSTTARRSENHKHTISDHKKPRSNHSGR